jgi:hypothetical protein
LETVDRFAQEHRGWLYHSPCFGGERDLITVKIERVPAATRDDADHREVSDAHGVTSYADRPRFGFPTISANADVR